MGKNGPLLGEYFHFVGQIFYQSENILPQKRKKN